MMRGAALSALLLTFAVAVMTGLDAPHGLALRVTGSTSISSGFFFVTAPSELDWAVSSHGPLRVLVDGRLEVERVTASTDSTATFRRTLDRGPHLIEIAHESGVTPAIAWRDANAHVSSPAPASAFAQVPVSPWRWRLRAARGWVGLAAASLWTVCIVALAWKGLTRILPGPAFPIDRPMGILLAGAAVAMLVGIRWGWPVQPWAPDELWPFQVLDGMARRFGGGWFELYPPGHFYVLSILYAPLLLLQRAGWLPLDPAGRDAVLHLMSRLLSVGMALGILVLVARFATQLGGRTYAWPAALCVLASVPFVFYTRLVNLEVPYLFWFCLSLLWFQAVVAKPEARSVAGFAATGMLAVISKDQAYALYVLPGLWLAWRLVRTPGGMALLASGMATAVVVFVLGHNLLFNYGGFTQHLASITGGGSQGYRMVPTGATGLVTLAGLVASQLWWMLGVPGMALCISGVWFHRSESWIPRWVWLFPCSYLALFVAVVGYSYDRFLLPVTILMALLGGAGLRGLLAAESRPRLSRAMAAIWVIWLVWRVASVDALQVFDSRYAAEDWLKANVPRGALVGTAAQGGYLPRLSVFSHAQLAPTSEATLAAAPDFVVVNTEFMMRYPEDAPARRWLRWLESSDSAYVEVFRVKRDLRWTELAWWPTFMDRRESESTNLDKANPEVVVFRRR